MSIQTTPRRDGHKQAATARRLTSSTMPAQHVLDATVEFLDESRDVIEKIGRYYTVWYVRSSKFTTRYYVVIWNYDRCSYQCSCGAGCKEHSHIEQVSAF